MSRKSRQNSVVSRAILKPIYQFGIPNSNPQMLKSPDFWCKLSSMFLVAEPREQCFELFRTQNSQKFPGFRPWTSLGRAYSTHWAYSLQQACSRLTGLTIYSTQRTPQLHNSFSHCYACWKTSIPKKLLDTALQKIEYLENKRSF